jgi:hypothetical protein
VPDVKTPLEEVISKEMQIAALSALMELPEFDRTLYLLKLNFDLTYADLAEIASRARGECVSEKAIQDHIYRTRAKLLAALRDQEIVVEKPDPATLRRRKVELIEVYADPIRTVLASKLIYEYGDTDLKKTVLDEHAKNVVLLVLRQVDVGSCWPPNAEMDAEVDRIINEYLNTLIAQR